MKLIKLLPAGAIAIISLTALSSCGNPGGLSDEEWNSLPPARRAELKMQKEANVEREMQDIQQTQHWNKEDNRNNNNYNNNNY